MQLIEAVRQKSFSSFYNKNLTAQMGTKVKNIPPLLVNVQFHRKNVKNGNSDNFYGQRRRNNFPPTRQRFRNELGVEVVNERNRFRNGRLNNNDRLGVILIGEKFHLPISSAHET